MKQQNRKTPVIFYVGMLLLCAVLITTHLTSGLYARYMATASSSDTATVARFEVGETLSDISQTLEIAFDAATTEKQYVQIQNTSEVAVTYTITMINLTGNLPISISNDSGTLSPNATVNVPFCVVWDGERDPAFSGMIDLVRVVVSVVQID